MLDLALEGTVVAVAADRGHHFSKRPQGSIVLVEEHGVEGDGTLAPSFDTGIWPAGDRGCLRQTRSETAAGRTGRWRNAYSKNAGKSM